VDARGRDFTIIARTDALATEGLEATIERARSYIESGADIIFAEALTGIEQYKIFTNSIDAPVLANLTEFGMTPLFSVTEMRDAGVEIILYPLSAARAMAKASVGIYQVIKEHGTQKNQTHNMQTRDELYETLNYEKYEEKIDRIIEENKELE